jgi:hypothetical protein
VIDFRFWRLAEVVVYPKKTLRQLLLEKDAARSPTLLIA